MSPSIGLDVDQSMAAAGAPPCGGLSADRRPFVYIQITRARIHGRLKQCESRRVLRGRLETPGTERVLLQGLLSLTP